MIQRHTTALYGLIDISIEKLLGDVQSALEGIKTSRKLNLHKPQGFKLDSAAQILWPIILVIETYLRLFREAAVEHHAALKSFVIFLSAWTAEWLSLMDDPVFADAAASLTQPQRGFFVGHLIDRLADLGATLERARQEIQEPEHAATERPIPIVGPGQLALMRRRFDPPGELRALGPRHDNDHAAIFNIHIPPTTSEIRCTLDPFLPATIPGAPHHLPEGTVERLLDCQFRLLREDIVGPLRQTLHFLCDELQQLVRPAKRDDEASTAEQDASRLTERSQLQQLLNKRGGRFKSPDGGSDLRVHGDGRVIFGNLSLTFKATAVAVVLPCPRNEKNPRRYWDALLQRSLNPGALVAYVAATPDGAEPHIFLGTVVSYLDQAKKRLGGGGHLTIDIDFFDQAIYDRICLPVRPDGLLDTLVEVEGVLLDSIAPFLRSLQHASLQPHRLPLSQYLIQKGYDALQEQPVAPPLYARMPGFAFDLSLLLRKGDAEATGEAPQAGDLMSIDEGSKEEAREMLQSHSSLDRSQADAVVDSLTREIALIQGPPGTGKSYTGVSLVRTLLKSGVHPIVIMCQTNHALDTFLRALLDNGVDNMVRLGSRSKDAKIQDFSLEHPIQKETKESTFAQRQAYRTLKGAEKRLKQHFESSRRTYPSTKDLATYLPIISPEHSDSFQYPPDFIRDLWRQEQAMRLSNGGKISDDRHEDLIGFWLDGRDLEELPSDDPSSSATSGPATESPKRHNLKGKAPSPKVQVPRATVSGQGPSTEGDRDSDDSSDDDEGLSDWQDSASESEPETDAKSGGEGEKEEVQEPSRSEDVAAKNRRDTARLATGKDRMVKALLADPDVWSYTLVERKRICAAWRQDMSLLQMDGFRMACQDAAEARAALQQSREQERLGLLRGVQIVGCTTNGAAKASHLFDKLRPEVLVVEEAGEVLEAHVLASLFPGLQQLVLIGDPMQLRPQIASYSLSIENKRGGERFRLDLSLMERLASETGLDMSQIDIQRRMRPEIADLVRPLYKNLSDHNTCRDRPNIRGMGKNVAFLDHTHPEGQGLASGPSKTNPYEVEMAVALARHLIKQGYTNEGDICILVTYLGQLALVRDRLAGEQVTVIVDERDAAELTALSERTDVDAAQADDSGTDIKAHKRVERNKLAGYVRCSTVDNFQGEEARIVILSLVRNSGAEDDVDPMLWFTPVRRVGIGFVKSTNRANVALSRARDGLYIMGNAALLASQTSFWADVVDRLDKADAITTGWPIQCANHPEERLVARQPKDIRLWAPDGGCSRMCDAPLACGHICKLKCHPRDSKHLTIQCKESCARLHEGCRHPCPKRCAEPCGDCCFPIPQVELECGHTASAVPCHGASRGTYACQVPIKKQLRTCEHTATVACSADLDAIMCEARCGKVLPCCDRPCSARCGQCQSLQPHQGGSEHSEDGKDEDLSQDDNSSKAKDATAPSPIDRKEHCTHACGKSFTRCSHKCSATCKPGHECGACQPKCRSTRCAHGTCTKKCSEPCRLCLMPCAWKACQHRPACSEPCGTPCSRLPCDEACPEKLKCGCPCPSVCGEPCERQTCPNCSREQDAVVDILLYRTLAEVKGQPGLDNRLITLTCGHTWTVETLDAHLDLESFYVRKDDAWIALREPSTDFQERKGCPTCRQPISSPRYGRVVGRALLDEHERVQSARAGATLQDIRKDLTLIDGSTIAKELQASIRGVSRHNQPKAQNKKSKMQRNELNHLLRNAKVSLLPFPAETLADARTAGVAPNIAALWARHMAPLMKLYHRAAQLCSEKSAHVQAWEAAIKAAYDRALPLYDPMDGARHTKANAEARRTVATPEPRGELRFKIEGMLLTLEIRLLLVAVAEEVKGAVVAVNEAQRKAFDWMMRFFLASAEQDAMVAVELAVSTETKRLAMEARVAELRVSMEMIRFKATFQSRTIKSSTEREALAKQVEAAAYEKIKGVKDAAHVDLFCDVVTEASNRTWFDETLQPSIDRVELVEMPRLLVAVRGGTFYQSVTVEERLQVIKAMEISNFAWSGHWYRCPKGHLFCITDCGMAMEVGKCPECGASIGGARHRLLEGNTRDDEMDQLNMRALDLEQDRPGWFAPLRL